MFQFKCQRLFIGKCLFNEFKFDFRGSVRWVIEAYNIKTVVWFEGASRRACSAVRRRSSAGDHMLLHLHLTDLISRQQPRTRSRRFHSLEYTSLATLRLDHLHWFRLFQSCSLNKHSFETFKTEDDETLIMSNFD